MNPFYRQKEQHAYMCPSGKNPLVAAINTHNEPIA